MRSFVLFKMKVLVHSEMVILPFGEKNLAVDINDENTIRRKLKMRPYNSVQMSSLRIRCYVFSVISVYKEKGCAKWGSEPPQSKF